MSDQKPEPSLVFPQLRSLHSGERLRVRGTIRKIDTLSIELEITELLLGQSASV